MPPLAADELTSLRADIVERGIVVPIVVDQHGRVLDGHHRRQVAAELGIDCPTTVREVADDDEALDIAVALNAARRHLTREQRRDLIRSELVRRPDDSDRAIARRTGASPTTVGTVRREVSNLDSGSANGDVPDRMTRDEAEAVTQRIHDARDGLLGEQVELLRAGVPPLTLVGWMRVAFEKYASGDPEIATAVRKIVLDPVLDLVIEHGPELAQSAPAEQSEMARRLVELDAAGGAR